MNDSTLHMRVILPHMTRDETGALSRLIIEAQVTYHHRWRDSLNRPTNEDVEKQEQAIVDYVNTLLATRAAEIERLAVQQITPEMIQISSDYDRWLETDPAPFDNRHLGDILLKALGIVTHDAIQAVQK